MNPQEMLKSLMGGNMNPQEMVMKMIGNQNPMFKNLMNMAQKGDSKGVETFARNICKERGIDFDKEFSNFMNNSKK